MTVSTIMVLVVLDLLDDDWSNGIVTSQFIVNSAGSWANIKRDKMSAASGPHESRVGRCMQLRRVSIALKLICFCGI